MAMLNEVNEVVELADRLAGEDNTVEIAEFFEELAAQFEERGDQVRAEIEDEEEDEAG